MKVAVEKSGGRTLFGNQNRGATLIEMALAVGLIAMIALPALKYLGTELQGIFSSIDAGFEGVGPPNGSVNTGSEGADSGPEVSGIDESDPEASGFEETGPNSEDIDSDGTEDGSSPDAVEDYGWWNATLSCRLCSTSPEGMGFQHHCELHGLSRQEESSVNTIVTGACVGCFRNSFGDVWYLSTCPVHGPGGPHDAATIFR